MALSCSDMGEVIQVSRFEERCHLEVGVIKSIVINLVKEMYISVGVRATVCLVHLALCLATSVQQGNIFVSALRRFIKV